MEAATPSAATEKKSSSCLVWPFEVEEEEGHFKLTAWSRSKAEGEEEEEEGR